MQSKDDRQEPEQGGDTIREVVFTIYSSFDFKKTLREEDLFVQEEQ